jgi:hypothetical protein
VTERPQDPQSGSTAEELFTRWLARHASAEPIEFEALCRARPEHESELRRLRSDWERIDSLMRKAGLGALPSATESSSASASTRSRQRATACKARSPAAEWVRS